MTAPDRSPAHPLLLAAATLAPLVLLLAGVLLEADPRGHGTHEQLGLAPCAPMVHLGVPCPGCGVTTAVVTVASGHPLRAFAIQPFGALLAWLAFAVAPLAWLVHLRGEDLWTRVRGLPRGLVWVAVAAFALGWVWKLLATW